MRGVPIVELEVETAQILIASGADFGYELFRFFSCFLGREHDRRAVRVLGADEVHRIALHPLEPHPDVGLDVYHDVAYVERAVRVGQGGGDEQPAWHADLQKAIILSPRARIRREAPGARPERSASR